MLMLPVVEIFMHHDSAASCCFAVVNVKYGLCRLDANSILNWGREEEKLFQGFHQSKKVEKGRFRLDITKLQCSLCYLSCYLVCYFNELESLPYNLLKTQNSS